VRQILPLKFRKSIFLFIIPSSPTQIWFIYVKSSRLKCSRFGTFITRRKHSVDFCKFRRRSKILTRQSLCRKCSFDFAGLGFKRGLEGRIQKILWEFNVVFPTFAKQDRVDTNFLFNKKLIIFSQFCGWVQPTLFKKKGIVCLVMSKGLLLKFTHILGSPSSIYDFASDPFWISLYIRKMFHTFLSVQYG
jgi:hypothetical protein